LTLNGPKKGHHLAEPALSNIVHVDAVRAGKTRGTAKLKLDLAGPRKRSRLVFGDWGSSESGIWDLRNFVLRREICPLQCAFSSSTMKPVSGRQPGSRSRLPDIRRSRRRM